MALICGLGSSLVLADQPAEDLPAPDSLVVEVRGGVIGEWWVKLQCSMWPAAVVVGGVPGKDGP
jgi:hypothetical protein